MTRSLKLLLICLLTTPLCGVCSFAQGLSTADAAPKPPLAASDATSPSATLRVKIASEAAAKSNATVEISFLKEGDIWKTEKKINESGSCEFSNLKTIKYKITVSAPDHETWSTADFTPEVGLNTLILNLKYVPRSPLKSEKKAVLSGGEGSTSPHILIQGMRGGGTSESIGATQDKPYQMLTNAFEMIVVQNLTSGDDITFTIPKGDAAFDAASMTEPKRISVKADQNGEAYARVRIGDQVGLIEIQVSSPKVGSRPFYILASNTSFLRTNLEFGIEFNRDADGQFGRQFFYAGLTNDAYLGRSAHLQIDSRLTSVAQRMIPKEGETPPALSNALIGVFNSRAAFESAISLYSENFTFKRRGKLDNVIAEGTKEAPDRITFGPILKYSFRTPITSGASSNDMSATPILLEPRPKTLINEFFGGLRLIAYPKRYQAIADTGNGVKYALTERNPSPIAYFNVMWGGSTHLANERRRLVVVDNVQTVARGRFTGRLFLEGYLLPPKSPIGFRLNANVGNGRDEIRLGVFTPITLNGLGKALDFLK